MTNILNNIYIIPDTPLIVEGAPPGLDALVLADLVRADKTPQIIFVARDGDRQVALADALRFFAPELTVVVFPAWD